jgi:hypothetical protein
MNRADILREVAEMLLKIHELKREIAELQNRRDVLLKQQALIFPA